MSIFDGIWARAARVLDTAVDSVVGDRLRYRHRGVWLGPLDVAEPERVVEGFVLINAGSLNTDEIDETLGHRRRVKISIALVDDPIQSDRIQHPMLGPGWFCPAGATPENDGRYWIFDVQGCRAP